MGDKFADGEAGVVPVRIGGSGTMSSTMNADEEIPLPVALVTTIDPDVAPAGTVAEIRKSDTSVNAAGVPLKLTSVAPVKN